jgi:hypothetical protein
MAEIVEVDFMAEQVGYKYLKPKAGSNYRQLFVNGANSRGDNLPGDESAWSHSSLKTSPKNMDCRYTLFWKRLTTASTTKNCSTRTGRARRPG